MVAHRAWRVKWDTSNNPTRGCCVCAEVEFLDFIGGADLTNNAAGQEIYSSTSSYSNGTAFDNSAGTFWHDDCQSGSQGWIGWDFTADQQYWADVKAFSFRSRNDSFASSDSPLTGGLEWSDDLINWTRLFSFETSNWGVGQKRFFEAPVPSMINRTEVNYTGDFSNFTVPAGATLLTIKAWGAGGHGGQYAGGLQGGGGAAIRLTHPVSPGDKISVQVGGGGDNWNGDPNRGGRGGWPDGGGGSRGDTRGGGGGGSTRVFINDELIAVAAGGGGGVGYACWAGGGGQGNSNSGTQSSCGSGSGGTQTSPGGPPFGWKTGRSIAEAGILGRTGGYGGYMLGSSSDDGGGGGGGFYGGGGGGGDSSGGGGSSWIKTGTDIAIFNGSAPTPGGSSDVDYPGSPIASGSPSNISDNPAGNGYALLGLDQGLLIPSTSRPLVPWIYAMDRPAENYSEGWRNYTIRFYINPSAFIASGNVIRLCWRGVGGSGTRIGRCFVGRPSDLSVNNGLDFVSNPVLVTFNGEESIAIPTDQIRTSDPINFPINANTPLLVSVWFDNLGPSQITYGPGSEFRSGWALGDFSSVNTSWSGANQYHYLESIQVQYDQIPTGGGGVTPGLNGDRRRYAIIVN